jgi:hypothetical protein
MVLVENWVVAKCVNFLQTGLGAWVYTIVQRLIAAS